MKFVVNFQRIPLNSIRLLGYFNLLLFFPPLLWKFQNNLRKNTSTFNYNSRESEKFYFLIEFPNFYLFSLPFSLLFLLLLPVHRPLNHYTPFKSEGSDGEKVVHTLSVSLRSIELFRKLRKREL